MTHFTEYSAIRRGNTLDCKDRTIGIKANIRSSLTFQIHILGGDLTVGDQLPCKILRSIEATLTVGNGHIVNIPHLGIGQPRRIVACHAGSDDAALVSAYDVKSQGGTILICINNLAVRDKPQLHKCLEAVTDAAHQTVPLFQQSGDLLPNRGVAEKSGNELTGTIRLIASREATGYKDDLTLPYLLCECLYTLGDRISRHILHYEDLRFCAGICHSTCGVIFAVCTGEYRNQDLRLSNLNCRSYTLLLRGRYRFNRSSRIRNIAGVNRLQLILIGLLQFLQADRFTIKGDGCGIRDFTDHRCVYILRNLQKERTVVITKDLLDRQPIPESKAQTVTKAHLHNGLSDTAQARCITGIHFAFTHQLCHTVKYRKQGVRLGQAVLIIIRTETNDLAARMLKLIGNNIGNLLRSHRKGYQCGRHIDIFKCTGHRILTANGSDLQVHLCLKRTQQRSRRLTPSFCILADTQEILLEGKVDILEACTGSNKFTDRFHNRQIRAVIGALLSNKRIIAPTHHRAVIGVPLFQTDLMHHCLDRCLLVLSTKGHQDCAGTDGCIKALGKTALGAGVQICSNALHILGEAAINRRGKLTRSSQLHIHMLFSTV